MRARLSVQGRVLFRVRAGEDPSEVPHHGDVALGACSPFPRFDGGGVERVLRRFTPAMKVARVFGAARSVAEPGRRHKGWDDLEVETGLSRTYRVDLDPDADVGALVSELAAIDAVEMASRHWLCETPFASAVAPARRGPRAEIGDLIGAAPALAREPGDSALIVAVLDSGVDLEHPEFQGRLRPGLDTVSLPQGRLARWIKLVRKSGGKRSEPRDDMGHGSATAGIIGAVGQRLAPGLGGAARLLPVRVLAGARLGDVDSITAVGAIPDIDAGVKSAVDLGARVLNLSFGTPESVLEEGDPPPHAEIIRYALARGCVLVAAAGNTGDELRYFPAALPGVIAVGSVGHDARPSAFSTRGPHVALCAPGEDVPTVGLGGYQLSTGTSFAAPFVTGACALLLAHAARRSEPLTPLQVRALLVQSATPFPRGHRITGCGVGTLNVPRALRALDAAIDVAPAAAGLLPTFSSRNPGPSAPGAWTEPQDPTGAAAGSVDSFIPTGA